MTYENIKSLILVILVGFSVLLTWSIWTYQPNYEIMEKAKTVQEVEISAPKDAKEIIKPDRIYYHYDKDRHYGTIDPNEIEKVMAEISRWDFSDFVNISSQIKNYSSFIHNPGNAVILFPDSIPTEFFRTIINTKEKKIPEFYFDRIVIDLEEVQKDHGFVYFVSTENEEVYRSHVSASFVHNFRNSFFKNAEYSLKYAKYFPYKTGNDRILFLPVEETKMQRYQYLSTPLDSEKFMNALFKNPSVVQKNHPTSGEEYTNGSSLMRVNDDESTLQYINPVENNESSFISNNLLKRSIDFINEHGGWTDNYRFVSMDELNHQVLFRLYDDKGYPVFSEESGISEISQTWGQNEIYKYFRSNFSIGSRVEASEMTLSSGEEVIQFLESEGYNMDNLEDLVLGYTMEKNARILYLEPSWYYRYNHTWSKLSMNEIEGGPNHGLE
ncbi:hypothetical protein KHA94_06540 [Bacillus sp. FJAT-49705]|uniref:Regulatory protein YycH domain-containing protein n=1 Tax=Cytobacillus citreus TaxID=2833586 RepID=A0ABS5NPX9_9BACI|nr:two-component system activity regulator YycH [Cytobacillus citreus]MBS4189860.1 hypothetical protein [Cytobacillus citreus]